MTKVLAAIFTLLLSMGLVLGQTPSGVTGTVTDPSGAVIPGVKVTLVDTKTSRELTTVTDDQGSYTFSNLQPGAGYRLSFSGTGFQTLVLNEVQVGIAQTQTQNVELKTGQVSETVEVVSTTGDVTLNTTDASLGNVIGQRELRELPIQIRGTPAALIGLQPGAVGTNVAAGATGGTRTGSVTGSRADQGNITVDGIDANDVTTQQAFNTVANAPIDAIQEFRAVTSGPGAAAGRSSGGQIELTTNSGTNKFHGNLREYYRTEKTAANSFFNNRNNIARPRLRRHQYGGSLGGPLPMFNFGENNGPMFKSGKDKLFFFFDYEARRDRSQATAAATVPLQHFRNGQIGYVNNTAGCGTSSRLNTTPQCISFQSVAQTQALDPKAVGVNQALLSFINSRYPLPNDFTGGDGRNTGVYRWNAPVLRDDKIYTTRFDATPTGAQRFFVRFSKTVRDSTNTVEFLPGDGDAQTFQDRSWAIASGHTWLINSNLTNVATVGVSKSQNYFTPPTIPSFPNSFTGGPLGAPFPSLSYQDREVTVPTIRDDMTYVTGNHTFLFGVSYKPIRQKATLINDFNFTTLGLGGTTTVLNSTLRPSDVNLGTSLLAGYDSAFAYLLGRIGSVNTNYNFTPTGTALAPGTGKLRTYAYNEYEAYFQDNWKVRSDLTLNLGIRYHLYPAPYEINGLQADHTVDFNELVKTRVQNAAAGVFGPSAEPFLVYDLSGKANGGTPLYKTDKNNFAPRLGFAWNPSVKDGFLGTLFGDKRTVIHGSAGMVYDRVGGGVTFIQNQLDYLFANSATNNFGNIDPRVALLNDARFISLSQLPTGVVPTAPAITKPFTPRVTNGSGTGLASGSFNYTVDKNFQVPYSYTFNFGVQREIPGNMVVDVSYVGRLGRKLFVQSDTSQVLNFKDAASGQYLFDALNAIQPVVAANIAAGNAAVHQGVTAQPWLENQLNAAIALNYGPTRNCTNLIAGPGGVPITNCAQFVSAFRSAFVRAGDTSDLMQVLRQNRLLLDNVAMSSQFATNAFITNQGSSDYHGMLVSLQKRFSKGFQFDVNYTFSKSLDNNSTIANTVSGGLVCDILNPDICRGPSDFDIRHLFNANFIWELPFGKGRAYDSGNWLVDGILGGWTISGIASARSGLPVNFALTPASFPLGFNTSSPAIVVGDQSAFTPDVRTTSAGIQYFADPAAAQAALRFPHHGELGSRNAFRGPSFFGLDMGLAKKFPMPWNESHRLTIRVDAFNVTNSNFFGIPNLTKESSSFGLITGSSSSPRELQFGIRYDF